MLYACHRLEVRVVVVTTGTKSFTKTGHVSVCFLGDSGIVFPSPRHYLVRFYYRGYHYSFYNTCTSIVTRYALAHFVRRWVVWALLSTCSMWHIWKARCSRVVGGDFVAVQKVVQEISGEVVLTLKALFDNVKGIFEVAVLKKNHFLQQWRGMGFFTDTNHKLQWEFALPKWLFPPPIT